MVKPFTCCPCYGEVSWSSAWHAARNRHGHIPNNKLAALNLMFFMQAPDPSKHTHTRTHARTHAQRRQARHLHEMVQQLQAKQQQQQQQGGMRGHGQMMTLGGGGGGHPRMSPLDGFDGGSGMHQQHMVRRLCR